MARDFILERYAIGNWPAVRGMVPFVCMGPRFKEWMAPGSLSRLGVWMPSARLVEAVSFSFPKGKCHVEDIEVLAEVLLRDGMVDALWSIDSAACLPEGLRWERSISEVGRQVIGSRGNPLPTDFDMAHELQTGLGMLASPEHYRAYVSEDGLRLESISVP